ncbi:MAG: hypothetical protein JSW41_04855 [Candidatus Aenigmatarchaeota archaeon]|nr:MAG: hypothetical protein JSW41_04855 [Candidatus Aenigmarchaeota archaeon]
MAFCLWCETGDEDDLEDGMFSIHPSCFHKMSDAKDDIKSVKKRLDRGETTEEIVRFIKRMEDFDRRWEGTENLLKEMGVR